MIEYLIEKLRDPVWQAIGTIIGVVALIASTIVAYDIYRKSSRFPILTVEERFDFDLLEDLFGKAMQGRVALLIDGSAIESASVYYYLLSNTGQEPITPDDYIGPIRVSVESPWELLAVDTAFSSPRDLKVGWTEITTNTFQMETALLNPGDEIEVLLLVTNPSASTESPELNWTARIVNVHSLEVRPRETAAEQSGLGIFHTGICHTGWNVYWLAGLAVFLFVVGLSLAMRFGRLDCPSSLFRVILLTAIMAFSFSSAEIFVDIFLEHDKQWWGGWILLGLNLALFAYLAWPAAKTRSSSISSSLTSKGKQIKEGKSE
jgi:hypothetical protein